MSGRGSLRRGSAQSRNDPVQEWSVRGNVHRGSVFRGSVSQGFVLGEVQAGKCPVGEMSVYHLFDVDFRVDVDARHDFLRNCLSLKTCCNCCFNHQASELSWSKMFVFYGLGFDWGWSDFIASCFDLFMFKMVDSLSRKKHRRNNTRANFLKTLEEARRCISNTRGTQTKYVGLQNNINRMCMKLTKKS